jgi:hypothetical protein
MLRANALAMGTYPFVIHNATGVAGQVDPKHNRPANLWEVPGIDKIMQAIKNVDGFMPANVGVGRHYNNEVDNPCRVTTIWPEDLHGANRRYCVEHADGFVCIAFGLVAPAEFVFKRACHVEAFDPVAGKVVQTEDVAAGGVKTIHPWTLDYFGHGGLVIRGTFT